METEPNTDAELVQRCVRGSRDAFAALTRRYYRPIGAFILKRVGQPALVEDLAQETFLEAYRALKEGRPPGQFASWLFGIAHHRCGKHLRRRRPSLFPATEPPDMAATPPNLALDDLEEQQRLLGGLESGLAALSEETRELLRRKHHQGQTCDQIAGQLGRPVGTIKSQLARAYKSLRLHLHGTLGRADL